MTLQRAGFKVVIKVRSPVMCQGLDSSGIGVDASFARDERNRPILPSDHIKGLILAAWGHRFGDTVVGLKGGKSGKRHDGGTTGDTDDVSLGEDSNAPNRVKLFATDFIYEAGQKEKAFTHRVAIDDDTGSAKAGALQEIELIAPLGAEITFTGAVTLYTDDPTQAHAQLKESLEAIPAVGGFKSAGFGEVIDVTVDRIEDDASRKASIPGRGAAEVRDAKRLQLDIQFDRPILVDADRVAHNVFRSSAIIPGAVIKGALAEALTREGTFQEQVKAALAQIRISHAFPLAEDAAGLLMQSPPRSLAVGSAEGDVQVVDVLRASQGQGMLIGGKPGYFANDWKGKEWLAVGTAMGWPTDQVAASVQRTHVAIGKGNVAEDEMLFAYQSIPALWNGNPDGHRKWRLTIDPAGADAAQLQRLLDRLALGLDGVGKTDAYLSVSAADWIAPLTLPEPMDIDGKKAWAVTLVTPTLMLDPDAQWDAKTQYEAYWNWAVSRLGGPTSVTLLNGFTHERLHGGYEAIRRGLFGKDRYQPLVITQPGSVFLIEDGRGVAEALQGALRAGLPPKPPAAWPGTGDLTWQGTTFVAENGYGQIAFYHDVHTPPGVGVEYV